MVNYIKHIRGTIEILALPTGKLQGSTCGNTWNVSAISSLPLNFSGKLQNSQLDTLSGKTRAVLSQTSPRNPTFHLDNWIHFSYNVSK